MRLFIRPWLLTVFLTDPDAASAQDAAASCDSYYWPTWPLFGEVRQRGKLSRRSLPVLAICRATAPHFWAARRQTPGHVLAVGPTTCLQFLPVYVGKLWRIPGVLYFSTVSLVWKQTKQNKKSPQKLRLLLLLLLSMGSLLGECLHAGVFTCSVVPTKVFQAEWLRNKLFIGWWRRDVLGGGQGRGLFGSHFEWQMRLSPWRKPSCRSCPAVFLRKENGRLHSHVSF